MRKLKPGEPNRIPITGIRIAKETWLKFRLLCLLEDKTIDEKLGEVIENCVDNAKPQKGS